MTRLARLFWISIFLMLAGLAMMFLWSMPKIDAGGLEIFDVRTNGYTYEDAKAFLAALTEDGKAAYLGPQRIADTIFPVGFLGFLSLGIFFGLRHVSRPVAIAASIVPIAYFVLDMIENARVAAMLRAGADAITIQQVEQANTISLWKYGFVNASMALLAIAALVRVWVWTRQRRAA